MSNTSFLSFPTFYQQRFLWNGARKRGFAEESGSVSTELSCNKNSFFFCCAMWGYLPSQASLLRPSPSLLTNSLCQDLPQAAPCNYSPMPQTGEMGVCYTLHAVLRKTTVGPLFVNQTQGQNKMLSGTSRVLVIIIENCQAKEHFIDFRTYLFINFIILAFSMISVQLYNWAFLTSTSFSAALGIVGFQQFQNVARSSHRVKKTNY